MKEQISIDKAIRRGRFIPFVYVLIMGVIMTIAIFIFALGKCPFWVVLTLFFPALIFAGLVSAFLTNKWKYWAFRNVRNVHELKKRATTLWIISEGDKFF